MAEEESKPAVEEEKPEPGEEVVEERLYTVPLRRAWIAPRGRRTLRAVKILRDFVMRHMKTEDVALSNEINEEVWVRSIEKPPRRIRIKVVKDKEGKVIVYPIKEEKAKEKRQ